MLLPICGSQVGQQLIETNMDQKYIKLLQTKVPDNKEIELLNDT